MSWVSVMASVCLSIMLGAEFHKLAWWASCTEGKTGAQLEAILRKYLEDHPERWDMLVNHLVYEMMNHYYPLVEYERTHAAEVRATKQILKDKLLEPLFEELR